MTTITIEKEKDNFGWSYVVYKNGRRLGGCVMRVSGIGPLRSFLGARWTEATSIVVKNMNNGKWHTIRGGKNGYICPLLKY